MKRAIKKSGTTNEIIKCVQIFHIYRSIDNKAEKRFVSSHHASMYDEAIKKSGVRNERTTREREREREIKNNYTISTIIGTNLPYL